MSTITKEWLQQKIADMEAIRDDIPFGLGEDGTNTLAAMRIALASLEAEAVAYIFKHPAGRLFWALTDESNKGQSDVMPVYTAPPAPVSVPAAMEMDDDFDSSFEHGKAVGWNAYRAAMLQGAENAESRCTIKTAPALDSLTKNAESRCGNSPVIQGGWVACSERMPEDGEKVLTSFRGWMRTAVCKVVDVLGHKIFVDELTLFNGVPADHWQPLPAAPQQEVTQALAKGMERYGDAMQKLADSGD